MEMFIGTTASSFIRFFLFTGNYFASHFFMGGEKFDTPHPEGYLFGENMDLNFLGNRPVQVKTLSQFSSTKMLCHFPRAFSRCVLLPHNHYENWVHKSEYSGIHTDWMSYRSYFSFSFSQFPYVTPAPHEPVKTLRSLVNIRKDSLRLVRWASRNEEWMNGDEDANITVAYKDVSVCESFGPVPCVVKSQLQLLSTL